MGSTQRTIITLALTAALVGPEIGAAASKKSVVGAVHEAGPGRVAPVTDVLYEIKEELQAPITICALFESSRARSKGSIEGTIWVLRPDQTGEACTFGNQQVVDGRAMACCQGASPESFPATSLVAAGINKQGIPRLRGKHTAVTRIEVFDGRIEAPVATGRAVTRKR